MDDEEVLAPEDLLSLIVDCPASLHEAEGVRDLSSAPPLRMTCSRIVTPLYRDLVDCEVDNHNMIVDEQPHLSRQAEKCNL
jgi:hypothetical protein